MNPRIKKLIGLPILLFGLFFYMIAAVQLGEQLPQHWTALTLFYVIAGVAWAWPAKWLVIWMNRPPAS